VTWLAGDVVGERRTARSSPLPEMNRYRFKKMFWSKDWFRKQILVRKFGTGKKTLAREARFDQRRWSGKLPHSRRGAGALSAYDQQAMQI